MISSRDRERIINLLWLSSYSDAELIQSSRNPSFRNSLTNEGLRSSRIGLIDAILFFWNCVDGFNKSLLTELVDILLRVDWRDLVIKQVWSAWLARATLRLTEYWVKIILLAALLPLRISVEVFECCYSIPGSTQTKGIDSYPRSSTMWISVGIFNLPA